MLVKVQAKVQMLKQTVILKLRELHSSLLFHAILRLTSRPLVTEQKSAIVFSPHQDDETLGCGGAIALKCEQNTPVNVVFLTDGCRSVSPLDPVALIEVRRQEARQALNILGVEPSAVHFLDQCDATLRSLSPLQRRQVIEAITDLLHFLRPAEVYVPHRADRHCFGDHEATYELVQEAINRSAIQVELLQYPVWLLWQPPLLFDLKPRELAGARRLSIKSVRLKKRRAIGVYQSQTFPQGFLKRFFSSYEIYFRTESS